MTDRMRARRDVGVEVGTGTVPVRARGGEDRGWKENKILATL